MEFAESDLLLRFAEHDLKICQTLPTAIDAKLLEESSEVAGWIEYAGENSLQLLIGVLYKATSEINEEDS